MAKDIMLDDDNFLTIKDGDLVVADSRYQHVKHLLQYEKGFDKFSPQSGVAMSNLINDEMNPEELLRYVRLEVERDGFKIEVLQMTTEGKLQIDGDYEDA
jgi:hypothetical protein